MDIMAFILSVSLLLVTPGPTNTLLAASGAAVGISRSLRLIAAEVAGYLTTISFLIAVVGPAIATHAWGIIALKALSSVWLIFCAIKLWRKDDNFVERDVKQISLHQLFVTTMLNPKALIFAFFIFPQMVSLSLLLLLGIFACLVATVGALWIAAGAMLTKSSKGTLSPGLAWQISSIALVLFSGVVLSSAITDLRQSL